MRTLNLWPTVNMKQITAAHMVLIHAAVIRRTGGSDGIRELSSLRSAAALPFQASFGLELYPTILQKAAVYARSIMMNHPFVDGNKRTGMSTAITFLQLNGYRFNGPRRSIEDFAVKIVVDRLDIEDIAEWFKLHTESV